jgi:DNA-binding NarL/FixJ family response regulator
MGNRLPIAAGLAACAAVALAREQFVRAAHLLGTVAKLLESMHVKLPSYDHDQYTRNIATLRARMGEASFNAAWEAGRRMTLDDAISLALTEPTTTPHAHTPKQDFGGLTPREREVAALVGQGMSNREIAEKLVVGERTIETHVSNIFNKLGFTARSQVRQWAKEKGL